MGLTPSGTLQPLNLPGMSNSMPSASSFRRIRVGYADDVPEGACLQVEAAGRSLGIFRVGGQFRAVLNHCPHEGAPICRGTVRGTTLPSAPGTFRWGRENEILVCPWHGWEFALDSGQCLTDRRRLATFPTEVAEDGTLYVRMRGPAAPEPATPSADAGTVRHRPPESTGASSP